MPRSKSATLPQSPKPSARRVQKRSGRGKPPPLPPLPLFPFFLPDDGNLFLAGSFSSGGLLVIQLNGRSVEVPLGVNSFAVLGVLALRLVQTQPIGPRAPVGFLQAPQLQRELLRWARSVNPQRLPQHIFRTREALEKGARKLNVPQPRDWARGLLEWTSLGYRLSAPPKQLEVYIEPDSQAGQPRLTSGTPH